MNGSVRLRGISLVFAVSGLWLWESAVLARTSGQAAETTEATGATAPKQTTETAASGRDPRWWDPSDGAFDVSGFLDQAGGFLPIVQPITEPAVGFGAALALMFLDRQDVEETAGFRRPNITIVGGLATQNGTTGLLATDIRHWREDRLRTTVTGFSGDLNFDFYGFGDIPALEDVPLGYNWSPLGASISADYRLGERSRWWVGLRYALSRSDVVFDLPSQVPPELIPDVAGLRNGGIGPSITFDSRNGLFTPSQGSFVSVRGNVFDESLGGERNYQTVEVVGIQYLELDPKVVLGLNGGLTASFGDVPFFLEPGISLRGVPMKSYQGENVAQFEAEVRWQFYGRYSLIGFSGAGVAWTETDDETARRTAVTIGTGLRYELARRYRLHAGVDVAYGPEGPAVYITFGSAWSRP